MARKRKRKAAKLKREAKTKPIEAKTQAISPKSVLKPVAVEKRDDREYLRTGATTSPGKTL